MQIDSLELEKYTGHDVLMEQISTGRVIKVRLSATSTAFPGRDYVYGTGLGIYPERGIIHHYRWKKGEIINDTKITLINNKS